MIPVGRAAAARSAVRVVNAVDYPHASSALRCFALTAARLAHLLCGASITGITGRRLGGELFARATKGVASILASMPRTSKTGMPSVVSEGLHIAGNLCTGGDVQIDGRVEGDVQGRNITVGITGRVIGKIVADEAVISGSVSGGIVAHSVVLTCTAKVACSITQDRMSVEAGAQFAGMVERTDLRLPKPSRMNGENETVLIERVYWTRQKSNRWVQLEA